MSPVTECEGCGTTQGVETVWADVGGRDREMHLCAACKVERLERRRVRVAKGRRPKRAKRPQRPPRPQRPQRRKRQAPLRRVMFAMIALLVVVLAAYLVLRLTQGPSGSECYPGAGFNCETPLEE